MRKKVDTSVNGEVLPEQKREQRYPLRLNSNTVIMVRKENLNEEYAEKKRIQLGLIAVEKPKMKGNQRVTITENELRRLREEGVTVKDIAHEYNCGPRTIARRIKEFGL
jgi:DNA-binding NarL/FixJ family response regulator